jgi:hypothetical protein
MLIHYIIFNHHFIINILLLLHLIIFNHQYHLQSSFHHQILYTIASLLDHLQSSFNHQYTITFSLDYIQSLFYHQYTIAYSLDQLQSSFHLHYVHSYLLFPQHQLLLHLVKPIILFLRIAYHYLLHEVLFLRYHHLLRVYPSLHLLFLRHHHLRT